MIAAHARRTGGDKKRMSQRQSASATAAHARTRNIRQRDRVEV